MFAVTDRAAAATHLCQASVPRLLNTATTNIYAVPISATVPTISY